MSREADVDAAGRALAEAEREVRAALRLVPGALPPGAAGARAHAERLRRAADLVGEWADAADALADLLDA